MKSQITVKDPENHFVTSDTHFNHDLRDILKARKVKTQEEANQMVINKINSTVPPGATLWHLGDVCLGDEENGNNLERLLRQLNPSLIYMLWGNHNSGANRIYRKALLQSGIVSEKRAPHVEVYPVTFNLGGPDNKRIIFLGDTQEVKIGKTKEELLVLSHFPFRTWHYNHKGSIQLCGHSHGRDPFTNYHTARTRCFDVGIDVVAPPSFEQVHKKGLKTPITSNDRSPQPLEWEKILTAKKRNRGFSRLISGAIGLCLGKSLQIQ